MRTAIVLALVAWFGTARADEAPSIVVVIDRALPAEKLAAVTETLGASARVMPAQTQLAVVLAGERPVLDAPLGPAAKATIRGVRGAPRGDLVAAIRFATDVLKPTRTKKRRILVVTDGDELRVMGRVMYDAVRANIRVSAIGYQSLNRVVLGEIAAGGEGRLFLVDNQAQLADVFTAAGKLVPDGPPPSDIALAIVIDRSVAMQGAALEAAKETARVTTELLAPGDQVGVYLAERDDNEYLPMQKAGNRMRISNDIAKLTPGGRSDLPHGLEAAYKALGATKATTKYVLLITNGTGSMDGVMDAAHALYAAKLVFAVVGVQGADRQNLSNIANGGDGRLYLVEDLGALPKIFMGSKSEPVW